MATRLAAALAAVAVLAGSGGCAYLDVKQRELIFRASRDASATPSDYGIAYEDLWLTVPAAAGDPQERVHGWWIPAAAPPPGAMKDPAGRDAPTVLYLHGTRWNLSNNLFRIARWHQMGFDVLAIDYRGFGRSDGQLPSEAQMYADARAAWDELRRREPEPRQRFIYGHSLGGAVAIELATRSNDVAGLIVESSFTSMRDMADATGYGYLPVGLVLTQRFDSIEKVARVGAPVLFIHGTADRFVPPAMSEKLFAAALEPKRLMLIEGGSHSNSSGVAFDAYRRTVAEFVTLANGAAAKPARVSAVTQ